MEVIDFARSEYGIEEIAAVWRVLQRNWLASGEENRLFEEEFARYIGTKHAVAVNSGSSANLLALAACNLKKGAHVLTAAAGFPATLAPILHLDLYPNLVDYDINTLNPNIEQVIDKLDGCSAVILAHTLGFPFDVKAVRKKADEVGAILIEDCCEAIGASIIKVGETGLSKDTTRFQLVGSIGHLGTFSFYPAHQVTALGSGGMVVTDDDEMARRLRSLRDWGKRWDWDSKYGDTVTSYNEFYYPGYTYETIGFNMKLAEANAAFGRENMRKISNFRTRRVWNHMRMRQALKDVPGLLLPSETLDTSPCPFGFAMTLEQGGRNEFGKHLERNGIRHRPFFAGNITRQPAFRKIEQSFPIADRLMKDTLFVGCWWPNEKEDYNTYIVDKVKEWLV